VPGFHAAIETISGILFWLAVVAALVCVVDWLIRKRYISPFGWASRVFRRYVDPLMAPIERKVVRTGGLPSSAPLWALAAVVIGGIVLLQLLNFVVSLVEQAEFVFANPAGAPRMIARWALTVLMIALLVRVISSWLPVSPYSPWIRWSYVLTEWFMRPLRQVIRPIRGIDISPIVAYFGLRLVQALIG
jgi:YggT family protein